MKGDYMADMFLERPRADWRSSFNRAQLTACRVMMGLCSRAIEAAERGNARVAEWFKAKVGIIDNTVALAPRSCRCRW